MKFFFGIISVLSISVPFPTWATTVNLTDYEANIHFTTWNSQGATLNFTSANSDAFTQMCPPPANWTIISHAWDENFQKEAWTQSIVNSFLEFRGGCVMFMDYG